MAAIDRLKGRIESNDDILLEELLASATDIIFGALYPYRSTWPDVLPARYETTQVDIASALYSKLGATGQVTHNENGINRTWGSEDVPKEILARLTPQIGVVRR